MKFYYLIYLLPTFAHATCIGLNCNCTISATTVNFGAYSPLSGSSASMTGDVAVTCSALIAGLNVSYNITLSKGSSSSFSPRTLLKSSQILQYNLYTNSGNTTIWGDGTSGTSLVSDSYSLNVISTTRHYTVYGLIPGSQNVGSGNYADAIIATVIF